MIQQLYNSKSELYLQVKELICSLNFPWYYNFGSTGGDTEGYANVPFYSHCFLTRPGQNVYYPRSDSPSLNIVNNLLASVLNENGINLGCFYRIAANCVHPVNTNQLTVPHYDHENLIHKNILVYLTDAGGETVVFNEDNTFDAHYPKEDDVIIFDGLHCHRPPKEKRRIVLVATFI